jgi:hypothetical protein
MEAARRATLDPDRDLCPRPHAALQNEKKSLAFTRRGWAAGRLGFLLPPELDLIPCDHPCLPTSRASYLVRPGPPQIRPTASSNGEGQDHPKREERWTDHSDAHDHRPELTALVEPRIILLSVRCERLLRVDLERLGRAFGGTLDAEEEGARSSSIRPGREIKRED